MKQTDWKSLTSHEGSPFLTWLHETSVEGVQMIHRIGGFITTRIPELLREWFGELQNLAILGCRAGFHLSRFIGVLAAWLGIVLAPLITYPGWVTLLWSVVSFSGSVWGLRRYNQKRAQLGIAGKEVSSARD